MELPPPQKDPLLTHAELNEMYDDMLEHPGAGLILRVKKGEDALERERQKGNERLTISQEAWENMEAGLRCWVGSRMTRHVKHETVEEVELQVTVKLNGKEEEGEILRLKLTIPDGGNRGGQA